MYSYRVEGVLGSMVSFTQSLPDAALHFALSLRLNPSAFCAAEFPLYNRAFTYTRSSNPVAQLSVY